MSDANGQSEEKNGISGGGDADNYRQSKGNEDKKVFVGGISADTTEQDLQTYFSKFGEVSKVEVKMDRMTGRPRGFAFVEFGSADACKQSLAESAHKIHNRDVEVKPAKSRENKKVFIGGLPSEYPEDDLKKHFEQFGTIEEIEWPFDKQRGAKRNFAFIVFDSEDAANRASAENKQTFGDRQCDVKKATPQRRGGMMGGGFGGRGGMRGGRGGGGYGHPYGGRGGGGYGHPYGGYNSMYGSAGGYGGWQGQGYDAYGGYGQGGDYGNDYWGQQQSHNWYNQNTPAAGAGGFDSYGAAGGAQRSSSYGAAGARGGYQGGY